MISVLGAVLGVVMGIFFGIMLMLAVRDEGLEVISVPFGQVVGLPGALAGHRRARRGVPGPAGGPARRAAGDRDRVTRDALESRRLARTGGPRGLGGPPVRPPHGPSNRGRGHKPRSSLARMTEVLIKDGRALKHVQVREYVRSLVSGMAPGSPRPPSASWWHQFGVARMTVRQAMDALVVEGLLERIPGKGTFVARPRAYGQHDHQLQRGDAPPRHARRVASPSSPAASRPAPASPARSTSPRATR